MDEYYYEVGDIVRIQPIDPEGPPGKTGIIIHIFREGQCPDAEAVCKCYGITTKHKNFPALSDIPMYSRIAVKDARGKITVYSMSGRYKFSRLHAKNSKRYAPKRCQYSEDIPRRIH